MRKRKNATTFLSNAKACMALFAAAMILALSPAAWTQVILDPTGTVQGTAGLDGESFGNGSTNHYTGSTSLSGTVDPVAGTYAVPVVADKENFNFNVYLYNFADTNGARLQYHVYNQPAVDENGMTTLDLKTPGSLIVGSVSVNAGAVVESITMNTYANNAAVPVRYYGYVNSYPNATPVTAEQPFPAITNARAYGTVRIRLSAGCGITRNLGNQYFDVTSGANANVNWTIDLTGVGCPTGALAGTMELLNLGETGALLSPSNPLRVYVYGPANQNLYPDATGAFSASSLPTGTYNNYSYGRFQAPYDQTQFPHQSNAFEITENTTTDYSIRYPVGTAHLSLDVVGTWGLSDVYGWYSWIQGSGPAGTSYAYDYQLTDGGLDYVLSAGQTSGSLQRFRFFSNNDGEYRNEYLYVYPQGGNRPIGEVVAGQALDLGTLTYAASEALVTFQVAEVPGTPNPLLQRLNLSGHAQIRDPDTNELLYNSNLTFDARNNSTQAETISVVVRGLTGKYTMIATAHDVDGKAYIASFELNLGEAQNTPVGEDVPQELVDDEGNTVATVTFDNVTSEGTTTISEIGAGPNAPANFAIFKNTGVNGNTGQFYYDIITTAQFDGQVQVCLNYDDTDMKANQEANLELGHYDDVADQWEIITETFADGTKNLDTANNRICGLTDSFSIFAGFVPLDTDDDDVLDRDDNCIDTSNPDQADTDGDGIGDACEPDDDGDGVPDDEDNCPIIVNPGQADLDSDGVGDLCDPDVDNDGVDNGTDNCPSAVNPNQEDFDGDGIGDACETDTDGDGIPDETDLCPVTPSSDNGDLDGDSVGDVCDPDMDNDGYDNSADNCPRVGNSDQADLDSDNVGDLCDLDMDGDGVANTSDNCEYVSNADQYDLDADGVGNVCDPDMDGDGYDNSADNCPGTPNSDQFDYDYDGLGDLCDTDDDADMVADGDDLCPNTPLDSPTADNGCSSSQLFELRCPTTAVYKNHGQYVSCVAEEAETQVDSGLITGAEKGAVVSAAAKSDIGRKK